MFLLSLRNLPHTDTWLDPETKAAFQRDPPVKIAPPTTDAFAVVVLSPAAEDGRDRLVRAFDRILHTTWSDAEFQTERTPPFVLKRSLTFSDALLAQFELICCDVISVFLRDDVVSHADASYLSDLYAKLVRADEFQPASVLIHSIAPSFKGCAFVEQFIGASMPQFPFELITTRKKARIMAHWADSVGVQLDVMEIGSPER